MQQSEKQQKPPKYGKAKIKKLNGHEKINIQQL